jgi:stage III sporulation protein AH
MKVLFFKEGKRMLSKKKKIFILSGMLILLVVTGYLNYALNKVDTETATTTTTSASFFTTYKTDRTTARDSELAILNEIIENQNVTTAEKAVAIQAKTELAQKIEKELILEGLIKAKGFEDAIVTIGSNYYNVIVKNADALTSDEVAQILSVITSETGCLATNIKIIPME